MFQHTATRRWLLNQPNPVQQEMIVSTHSHPKVAAASDLYMNPLSSSFNTQPPEGGCLELFLLS